MSRECNNPDCTEEFEPDDDADYDDERYCSLGCWADVEQ